LLIQPLCQISKWLYGECIPCDYLRTAPPIYKSITIIFQTSRGVTKVRNSDQINHLPLKIFLCLPSQGFQLYNEWSFCSIKSFFISQKVSLVGDLDSVIHQFPSFKMHANESQKLAMTFVQTRQTTFLINPQVP
jgi:hypothetical protein